MAYYSWQTPSENLARVTRERAARRDDMKRGEIFEFGEKGSMGVATGGKQNGGLAFMWIRGWPEHKGVDSNPKDPTPYTGPTYEKAGQRFVPSGEGRVPELNEYYLSGKSHNVSQRLNEEWSGQFICHPRVILLPVPDLPEEHPCDFCDGKGELLTICERCHGTGELTKPDGICPTCKGGIL